MKNKGITLIALIITIIVLLILAGVSIASVIGDNGIASKSTKAKKDTERSVIVEEARTEVLSKITENEGENLTKEQLKTILLSYFDEDEVEGLEIPDDASTSDAVLTSKQGNYKINLTEIYSGPVYKAPVYARDVLLVNTEASEDYLRSPYVNYRSRDDESTSPFLCRVIYDKNDPYGLQIITVEPVREVGLGYTDNCGYITGNDNFEKSLSSWNRVVQTLNEYAESYMDTENGSGIVSDARCVGSDPANKNDESPMITRQTNDYGPVSMRDHDTHYITDYTRLQAIEALGITYNSIYSNGYYLASREASDEIYGRLGIRNVYASRELTVSSIANIYPSGSTIAACTGRCGLRPVFTLNSDVKIIGGSGTREDPYELGK